MEKQAQEKVLRKLRAAARRHFVGMPPKTNVHKDRKKEAARKGCRKAVKEN